MLYNCSRLKVDEEERKLEEGNQNGEGQSRAGQFGAVQDSAGQNKMRQEWTGHDMTWYGNAGQGCIGHWIAQVMTCRAEQIMVSHYITCHGTIQQIRMEQIKLSKAGQRESTVQPVDQLSQR
jgi:hypothetical protein